MTRETFVAELGPAGKTGTNGVRLYTGCDGRVLGISKKTLVEIEKGRSSLGWTGAVALCSIFSGSQVLSGLLGGEAGELVRALAFQNLRPSYPKTMGGKVWWRFVETLGPYTIQQNLLSQHYRALDPEDGRVCSSFDLEEIRQQLRDLEGTS